MKARSEVRDMKFRSVVHPSDVHSKEVYDPVNQYLIRGSWYLGKMKNILLF